MHLPVTLAPRPSWTLAVALVLAHALAALGLMPTGLPPGLKYGSGLILALSLAFTLSRHVFRPPLVALTLKADGRLELNRRDGTLVDAAVHPHTAVFPLLVVLLMRAGTGTVALTLPYDALDPESHRKLRLWLRWKAALSVPA